MNRSIITTPTNKRVFGACLLSFMILIAPIASVGAATLRATTPPANKQLSANEKMEAALFEPAPVGPPVPSVTATKTDSFPVHPGGKAQPGDQITYDIGITNAGTDATNATYTDTIDPNTTLVPGSLKVSPVAAADSYVAEKDVALSVAAGTGVLVNDFGTPAPTVGGITNPVCVDNTAPFTCTTTGGGTVVMEADGSFLYTPLVGFTGTDTFTYTATNSAAGGLAPDDTAVVTIEVDARPTVTTTTPADTATGVVTTANIVINFSESVTASTSSFTINCPAPGNAQAFTVTGSGTSTITLDPTGNLPAGTTCTVTVIASQISDVDSNDPPDLMSADYVFSFTTDAAPTVTNTTPVNGASSVPTDSNIVVTFSEAVTASGTAFTIECPAPGNAQAYSVSGSGTNTITVNPTSNLPNATLCTVTVLAAQVADTDTNDPPDNMAANFVFSFTTDGAPAVTTTVPTDTATGVAISSNITINFNEAVNATIASFSLECPVGSPKTFTVTGSGTSQIVLDPTVDLPIGTACRVTVIASQISDTDTADPPDNMVANYVFNFTTDFAPSVTATTPINGATQVANNTDVTVTFSEPVNVSGAWFSIVCGTSGTHDTTNSTVGGGPSTFTINPTDFANGESCTATIFAAQVSDQDTNDPPDNMAANFVFSFTVDNPPSVSSTTPINGATGVAANTNLTVTFSETVNVTGNWFQIVCGTQTKNPGDTVVTGGPTTFTINPNTDLLAGNICSVTVFAAQVTDQDSGDPPDNMTANHVFSFSVPPLAVNDAYAPSILGNVGVNTDNSTEFSVLANDTPTSGVTINQSGTSTQGGAVVVAADGKFSYIPPAGYEGPDSFTYTISNASGTSNSATVSFTVAGMIWFINAAAGPGDGRLATPFNSVASFQAVNDNGGGTHPGNGDNIFIYENASSYTGPITLLSNQKLIGQDATATLAAIAGVSVPADSFPLPAMNTGAPATTLSVSSAGVNVVNLNGAGTGNTVRGLTLTTGSATTKGISGTTFGTLTTADLIISGSGPAIDLTTGTLSGSFNSISSSGGVNGIRLSAINSASTIPFGTGALSGATAEEFFITGTNSTIALTYDGTISTTAAASRPVSISGKTTSGNVTFNGAISGTSSSGVLLDNNDGATITFRGGLALSTTTNTAFNAINGGTIEVCDENPCNPAATGALVNTLTTSTGVAINVNATTISANNLEFRSISSNGASSGIVLNTTGASGGLKVKGNSAGNCGGVVTPNAVGTPATITAPVLADCTGGSILNSTSDGVSLNSTNNVSLTRMRIQDSTDSGVFGNNVSGLSLVSSWFESNGDNTLAEDSGLEFQILTGTNNVTNCTISNNFEFSVNWTPSSGTGTLNISGTNIGPNPAGVGANGVHFTNSVGVGNSTLIITNSNVDGHQATGIQANASGSATQNIKIHNTTIKNNNIAIQLTSDTDADTNFNITNNTIIDHANFAIGLVPVSTSTNNSQFQGSISGNVIGDGSVDSGSRDAYGIRGDIRGDVDAIISVTNNTVRNTDIEAIFIEGRLDADADAQNGKLDLTVTGNDGFIPDDNSAFPFFTVYGSRIESRDTFNVCLDFGGSAALSNDAVGKALEDWRLRQRDTSTFRLERFVGSGTSDTDVEAFMLAQNPDLSSADATHATTYTGVANGTCRSPVIPAGIAMNLNPFDRNSEMLASNSESKSSIFGVTSGVGASVDFTSVTTGVAATSSVPNANPTARYDNVAAQIEAKGISQPELATAQSAVVRKSGESDQAISQAVSSRRAASFAKPTIVQNQKPVGSPGSAKQGFSHHARRTPKGASLTPRATTTTPVLNPACGVGTIAICLGTLKAGKTVNIQFKVTINTPFPGTEVTNQGSVGFDGGGPVLTDDPAVGGAADPTVTPVQTCTAPPVPANMVAWWSGDDTPRDIAGGNDGTLNGGMGYAAGKVLNGFGLDGTDDFVSAPDSAGLSPTQTISIDAWVNPDTLVADASGRTIVSKYDSSTAGESSYLLRMINGGQIEFVVYGPGGENRSVTTPGAISTGAFTHVAATFDNATDELKVYINGVDTAAPLGGGSTAITSINDSTTPVRIGALKEGASLAGFFDGVIDEVEIFNVVLTPAQVLDLFSADAGGKCKPSDLTITKTHTDPFVQGSTGNTYTITVHNDGPGSTAGTVTVIDTVPTGLTPTGPIGAHNGWNCSIVGQIVTCDRSDSLAASADYPTITLTVTAGANSASVINNVTVSGGGEMDTSDSSASDTTNLSPSSDLLSVKVEDVDPVTAGTNITYTITLTNNGPSDAQTVTLTDAVPANTTFVSFTQDTGPVFLCSMPSPGGTGNVSCSLATLPTGA
ncbi:MAG TPA: Ig-like domain-containing protein, partial [Pyrinomonadaceae bacterium]|nr:Ig-like domain-containing protein [Pyrinomonadaceae bacterium]